METETVLSWLDEIRYCLPGNDPALLEDQFERVKQHIVRLENERQNNLRFAQNSELFGELASRFDACVVVAGAAPKEGQEQVICLSNGPKAHCLGLLPFGQNILMSQNRYGYDSECDESWT